MRGASRDFLLRCHFAFFNDKHKCTHDCIQVFNYSIVIIYSHSLFCSGFSYKGRVEAPGFFSFNATDFRNHFKILITSRITLRFSRSKTKLHTMAPALAECSLGLGGSFATTPRDTPDPFQKLVADLSRLLGPSSGLDSADVNVKELQKLMEDYVSCEKDCKFIPNK